MIQSYEFDPCTLDDSYTESTLDSWKPRAKTKTIAKSEWRQKQNAGNHNQQPGLDELRKIHTYIKKKYPDFEIMDAFAISSETLVAIKRDCYCPVEGISLDNLSKIYKKFTSIETRMAKLTDAIKFIADNGFEGQGTAKRGALRKIIKMRRKTENGMDEPNEGPDDII